MEEVLEAAAEAAVDTVEVGRPRREPEGPQFLDPEQAEALIEQARVQGVELLGEDGLLRQMTKAVLERALAEELTDHLAKPPIRPCWVTDRYGRLPGLLMEWRRTGSSWQGRVVRPVLENGAWIVVEEWMPAELLEEA